MYCLVGLAGVHRFLYAGNGLHTLCLLYTSQFCDFIGKRVLLFGILCVKCCITGVRQLPQHIILINFANQLFQFSGPFLRGGKAFALLGYIGGLLGGLCFLNSADKFGPVILGILRDSPCLLYTSRCV